MFRLDSHPGEWIDRTLPLAFIFEGREYRGFSGDTISSALGAEGVAYLARSFKYHRPRSILSFANHDSNVMLRVDGVPVGREIDHDVVPSHRAPFKADGSIIVILATDAPLLPIQCQRLARRGNDSDG